MITVKELVKDFILKNCSANTQQKLRRSHAIYQIRHNRHFQEPEMALIKSLVSEGDVVADIGANVGVYTNALSHAVGAHGKVFSFEPVSDNYEILTALVLKTNLQNVSAYRVAIGSRSRECEIVVPEMSGFTGYYWAHIAQPQDGGRRELVRVITLDDLHRDHIFDRLNFIKCDVEGGELDVIVGGLEIIRSQVPAWLIEVSRNTSSDVFVLLHDLGYRAFVLDGRLIETKEYRDGEFSNYFFLHPRSAAWGRIPQ
jgi:FkbM family methyltransferase